MPVKIFFCYAHEDEPLLDKLKKHLSPLQWKGLIDPWHDRNISAGMEWEKEIKEQLNTAQIILLLISSDFMASKYCYSVEMKRAVERHERGEACVIPIILRHVYWQGTPFGKLQALPKDAKPVKSWSDPDEALFSIAEGIRLIIEDISKPLDHQKPHLPQRLEDTHLETNIKREINSSDNQTLKSQFYQAMLNIYKEASKIGYPANQFVHMVHDKGGVETAQLLIAKDPTDGFTTLWRKNRLDLSVEALILKPQYASLFDKAEREKARQRLAASGYKAPWDNL